MGDHRPRKVQRILQLEGKAATARAAYEATLARIAPAKHKAQQYHQQAKALKVTQMLVIAGKRGSLDR